MRVYLSTTCLLSSLSLCVQMRRLPLCLLFRVSRGTLTVTSSLPHELNVSEDASRALQAHTGESAMTPVQARTKERLDDVTEILSVDDFSSRPPYVGGDLWYNDETPEGVLEPLEHVVDTHSSVLFTARFLDSPTQSPMLVLKYTNDCSDRLLAARAAGGSAGDPPAHPLVKDATFLFTLRGTGLVVNVRHLSGPSRLVPRTDDWETTERMMSELLVRQFDRCMALGTRVRFLVTDLAGPSVSQYIRWLDSRQPVRANQVQYLSAVVQITVQVVELLRDLHATGVVHGDVHGGNILFKDSSSVVDMSTSQLVLIDFEFALFYPVEVGMDARRTDSTAHRVPALLSPWELQGFRTGRRDDVFRAIECAARLLSRGQLEGGLDAFSAGRVRMEGNPRVGTDSHAQILRDAALYRKTDLPYFKPSAMLGTRGLADMGLHPESQVHVENALEQVLLDHVSGSPHPDAEPNYGGIITQLNDVLRMVSDRSPDAV